MFSFGPTCQQENRQSHLPKVVPNVFFFSISVLHRKFERLGGEGNMYYEFINIIFKYRQLKITTVKVWACIPLFVYTFLM